jgi:hypothetical protein
MTIRLIPRGVEEAQFKSVPEGWTFTAKSPWIFGPRRFYLVSEAQKPVIAARVRGGIYVRTVLSIAMVPLLIAAHIAVPSLQDSHAAAAWLGMIGFVAMFVATASACEHLILRPLLRDLPRTPGNFTTVEMLRRQSEAMSIRTLSTMTLLCAVAAAMSFGLWWLVPSKIDLFLALSAALCMASAIVFFAMLTVRICATTE